VLQAASPLVGEPLFFKAGGAADQDPIVPLRRLTSVFVITVLIVGTELKVDAVLKITC
jgi:hypothetical protein